MIRRIVLENYMSHANTVIEPVEGLTVLVGPNNCGKSAVVSALLTVCGENDGDFMVRHGQKHARVTVETAEGDVIVWQRKGKSPSYVINGRDVHRVGRGNLPDDLQPLLKLPVIEFGDGAARNRFHVHFGLQKEPIFLINSETDVARFFASSAESEHLMGMQRRHKKRTQDARGEQRSVEADLKHIDEQLQTLEPLEALGAAVEAVEAEHRALGEALAAVDGLRERIGRVEAARLSVAREEARVEAAAPLLPPPEMQDPAPLERLISRIERGSREAEALGARGLALQTLHDPPETADDRPLALTCVRMADLSDDVAMEQRRIAALAALQEPPAPIDLKPLIDLGKSMTAKRFAVERLEAQAGVLAAVTEPPTLSDDAPLVQTLARLGSAAAKVAECEKLDQSATGRLNMVRDEIIAWVTNNPTCPVCGAKVQRERMLETEGSLAD